MKNNMKRFSILLILLIGMISSTGFAHTDLENPTKSAIVTADCDVGVLPTPITMNEINLLPEFSIVSIQILPECISSGYISYIYSFRDDDALCKQLANENYILKKRLVEINNKVIKLTYTNRRLLYNANNASNPKNPRDAL